MTNKGTYIKWLLLLLVGTFTSNFVTAQSNLNNNKFKQLGQELPTPNVYRAASGAPGHEYWQQQADYKINVELDDDKQRIYGDETITYYNNSPDMLTYLWLQLDQNVRQQNALGDLTATNEIKDRMSPWDLAKLHNDFDGGFKIEKVTTKSGAPLPYTINATMMRIDLPTPLKPGGNVSFSVKWWYNINDRMKIGGRSGYEYFEEDDNYLYTIAQFYPRMVAYNDVYGWQHKQFLGRGEFTLNFGNYEVNITAPADHVVASTGTLQNASNVLTTEQRSRYQKAKNAKSPIMIITESEAREAEKSKSKKKKTWTYKADNVRDFAFASSRKFIWDAMGVPMEGKTVMAMSYYPKEGNPLWEQYSTKAVAHTLRTYSKYTFAYPYPVAISVHAARIGMEYPMICFNFGRPEEDGTYSARTKYGMIGVIIHEVGHNYFPMIVNSDERQWTWMDEGMNSFLQYLTEQEWEEGYPSRRGPAYKIVDYMKGDKSNISPIMTNSESIFQFGNNAYGKPATALNILRETIMGRELFDFAFKEYANRWMFKSPSPADFFRTMEDASGVDLDWFWRGWFYTNDHVDISMDKVLWYQIDTKDPDIEMEVAESNDAELRNSYITNVRNAEEFPKREIDKDESLKDFYNLYNPYEATILDKQEYDRYMSKLSENEKAWVTGNYHYYELSFSNIGGLVMPLILEFEYTDGEKEVKRVPAEVWRRNSEKISKVFVTEKEIARIVLDPFLETADTDRNNNYWPARQQPTRFEMYKRNWGGQENPMQRAKRAEMEEKQKNDSDK